MRTKIIHFFTSKCNKKEEFTHRFILGLNSGHSDGIHSVLLVPGEDVIVQLTGRDTSAWDRQSS